MGTSAAQPLPFSTPHLPQRDETADARLMAGRHASSVLQSNGGPMAAPQSSSLALQPGHSLLGPAQPWSAYPAVSGPSRQVSFNPLSNPLSVSHPLSGQQSQIVKALGEEGIARLVPAAQDVTHTVLRGLWGRGAGDC